MKQVLALLLFLAVTISGTVTVQAIDHQLKYRIQPKVKSSKPMNPGKMIYPVSPDYLLEQARIALADKGPIYYVKIGDTISLLKDPQGYIIAANRLGMTTIKVVPDKSGKYYRTVSLDLNQSDEDIKKAIEVETENIIIK